MDINMKLEYMKQTLSMESKDLYIVYLGKK